MVSCRRRAAARVALALLAAVAVASPATAADDDDSLTPLMQRLALRVHGHATFVEQQYLAILDRPLESSGELFYDAPDHLEKRTLKPKRESVVLNHGELQLRRGNHTMSVALRDYPQLAPFIDSIRATLAGDRAALEQTYVVTLESRADDWTLALVPRVPALRALIAAIRITGTTDLVRSVEVKRADGDHSLMTITALAVP